MSRVVREIDVKVNGKETDIKGLLIERDGSFTTYIRVLDFEEILNIDVTGHGTYINVKTSEKKDEIKSTVEDILGVDLPPVEKNLLTNTTEFSSRKIEVKKIVLHWTANTSRGANEDAHRSYFNRAKYNAAGNRIYANYNFIIGNRKILQLLEDGTEGWHAGHRETNRSSIGISMCVNRDYDFELTEKYTAYWVAVQLNKYNLSINDLIRHHDVTGKNCPAMYVGNNNQKAWQDFRNLVEKLMKVI